MCCWISFVSILLKIFASIFYQKCCFVLLFFCRFFVWLWYQSNAGLIYWVANISSSIFYKTLKRSDINSLNACQNSPVKSSGSELLFAGNFLTSDSIISLFIDLFRFPFFLNEIILVCWIFLGICPEIFT